MLVMRCISDTHGQERQELIMRTVFKGEAADLRHSYCAVYGFQLGSISSEIRSMVTTYCATEDFSRCNSDTPRRKPEIYR